MLVSFEAVLRHGLSQKETAYLCGFQAKKTHLETMRHPLPFLENTPLRGVLLWKKGIPRLIVSIYIYLYIYIIYINNLELKILETNLVSKVSSWDTIKKTNHQQPTLSPGGMARGWLIHKR